jgi:regulatory protein
MKKPDFGDGNDRNAQFAGAYLAALRLLGIKPRTEREIRVKITERYSDEAAEHVIALLNHHRYIDDERYAFDYCRERTRDGYGGNRIRMELQNRGVESSVIDRAISEVCHDSELLLSAQAAFARRYPGGAARDMKEREKQYGFLFRRGFDKYTIDHVFKRDGG